MAQQQKRRQSARQPSRQGRHPSQQGRRPAPGHSRSSAPAHAAAHVRKPAPKRRSLWPIIVAVLVLVFAGLLALFVVRSCNKGGTSNSTPGSDQSTVEPTTQTEETEATKKASDGSTDIKLLMVGDILYHYQVRMSGLAENGSRNYDHVFAHVLDEIDDFDIKVLNQETPLGGPVYTGSAPDGYDGYPEFNGPQEIGDAEVKAGFNVALKATNHAMDNASNFEDPYTLVRSEQNYWAKEHPEMTIIGEVNPDDPDASVEDVYVYEKDGFKVALLNYTLDLNGNESFDTQGVVSMLEEEHVASTMAKAHELADMVVVFPHWGEEYSLEPVEMQYEWAQVFVDAGADVIIGNHPHVIEPVTVYEGEGGKKVPCYWSTGNFISTSPSSESLIGGIAEVTLHKSKDGECSVTSAAFKPVVTHLGMSTDMTTYLITDWTDELAASNWLNTEINPDTDNTNLTVEWANNFCTQVLGEDYDAKNGVLQLEL